jgi:hypothetical protein
MDPGEARVLRFRPKLARVRAEDAVRNYGHGRAFTITFDRAVPTFGRQLASTTLSDRLNAERSGG